MQYFPEHVGVVRRQTIHRLAAPQVFAHAIDLEDFTIPGREAVVTFLRETLNELRWLGLNGRRDYDPQAHRGLSDCLFQEQLELDRARRREACRECI